MVRLFLVLVILAVVCMPLCAQPAPSCDKDKKACDEKCCGKCDKDKKACDENAIKKNAPANAKSSSL